MKKLLALALATAVVFGSTPVLAGGPRGSRVEPRISVENETRAKVKVTSTTLADTGSNQIASNNGAVTVKTGEAEAESLTLTAVGSSYTSITDPCGCPRVRRCGPCQRPVAPQGGIEVENETGAKVKVTTDTEASSGYNVVTGNNGAVSVTTDEAEAESSTVTLIGTNITVIK